MQVLGLKFSGYLIAGGNEAQALSLFDGPTEVSFLGFDQLSNFNSRSTRFLRVVLGTNQNVNHDPSFEAGLYFEESFYRERTFAGITHVDWHAHAPRHAPRLDKEPLFVQRRIESFSQISQVRRSADSFQQPAGVDRKVIEQILIDSYYRRGDGHLPYGAAGGLGSVKLSLVNDDVSDLPAGVWDICPDSGEWTRNDVPLYPKLLFQVGLIQETYKHCSTWFLVKSELSEISQKYGCRSLRFSLLHAGSLLHQMHLSCTSLGVPFRVLGGFDDGLISSMLKLNPSESMVIAMAAFGGSSRGS
jgi:SagB-type dehydrogenase family enzyme